MPEPIIKVESLSKKFIIAHEAPEKYTTLRDVIARKTKRLISGGNKKDKGASEEFWALWDLNFEVNQGDRIGVIGRNGAGKSTLLKVLSRITDPTSGRVTIRGRVASLLEVGTGFHPELTGRENVFLNGAILGMSRAEIKKKFDEIVSFAEVEKFLDTPVKRYSSGMYVRLAFAVAAHLEPEILVVDEVLAVGDAQFQKKCLGKMEDVSKNEGRTVIFVSHNMGVISQLCQSAIVLQKGKLEFLGSVNGAIAKYMEQNVTGNLGYTASPADRLKNMYVKEVVLVNESNEITDNFLSDQHIYIKLNIGINELNPAARISITLQSIIGDFLSSFVETIPGNLSVRDEHNITIKLPNNTIAPNSYALRFAIFVPHGIVYDLVEMVCPFRIVDGGSSLALFEGFNYGCFFMNYEIVEMNS